MKKYLRRFKTEAEYQAFINDEENFLLPNVSYVEDTTTSYFNDKEEVIPAIIYAKYNATAENMVLSLFPENIKSLKIDGNSIEMVTPQKEVKTINVLAANVNYNPDNGEMDMPQEYFISNMPLSLNLNVANDTMASIEYNYVFMVMEEDGVMMAESIDSDSWINGGFTYNKDDNSITAAPIMFMQMPDNTSLSFILGNVDMEKGEATFFDTNIKITTLTSNNLPSPYMFETEGIHDVEIELCDETSFGLMFTTTCIQEVNIPGTVSSTSPMSLTQCNYLTSVTFNNGLKGINQYSLYYCPSLTTLVLPDTLEYIGTCGCAMTGLTELVLPDSVTSIGNEAFYNCQSLTSITIPDSVTSIGEGAFAGCPHIEFNGNNASEDKRCIVINGKLIYCNTTDLTSYNIPNSVTEIGDATFRDCRSLTSITIPESVTTIGDYVFYQCSNLASVDLGNGVTSIGDYAFQSCGLTSITIPGSVTTIGEYAFFQCDMQSITISEGVTSIGAGAFGRCSSLTSITIPDSVTEIGDSTFSGCTSLTGFNGKFATNDKLALIVNDRLIAFASASGVTTYIIPDGVTSIGAGAFEDCESLTEITIPEGVTEIGDSAFHRCSSLTSVTIPDSVTSIGEGAFYYCHNLVSITIPNSVTEIGSRAFRECHSLTEITIPDSVTEIGEQTFYGCSKLDSITIPDGVTSIGDATFCYCNGLTEITIPNSVTYIGWNAFQYCTSLTEITIPNSVTKIGRYAFYGCKSLTSITIPDSVSEIGDSTFYGCSNLAEFNGKFATNDKLALIANNKLIAFAPASSVTTYIIPDGVTTIGYNAFRDCSKLTSITIPEGVTEIGTEAFRSCTSLTEITIPDSVTTIGSQAFEGCSKLTSVYCKPTTPPKINGSNMFDYNAEGRKIYVPMASVDAYKSADSWSKYSSAIEGYNF